MARRNFWTVEETLVMLQTMQEKQCLRLLDGKKYRNNEIFKLVEEQMRSKGYERKNHKQIEVRWKNLKCNYVQVKRHNNTSGYGRETCPFFDELDRMLGSRPSTTTINNGIDTSKDDNTKENEESKCNKENDDPMDYIEFDPSLPSTSEPRRKVSNARRKNLRNIDIMAEKIQKTQEKLTEDFFCKQKDLVDYEFKLYAKEEEKYEEKLRATIKQTTKDFLTEIKNIFKRNAVNQCDVESSQTDNIDLSHFFQSWNDSND